MKNSCYIHVIVASTIVVLFIKCTYRNRNVDMKPDLVKIYATEKPVSFFQIDFASGEYILSYSHSAAISGGVGILRKKSLYDSVGNISLISESNSVIDFISVKNSQIGFIGNYFKEKKLNSTLTFSNDTGKTWFVISTPLGGLIKFITEGNIILAEGYLNGSGQLFRSSNNGTSWETVNTLQRGFKSFFLLKYLGSGKVLCKGSRSFNYRNNCLLIYDIYTDSICSLLDLNDNDIYITPISNDKQLHAIQSDNSLFLYSFLNDKFVSKYKLSLPSTGIEGVFLSDRYCVLLTREKMQGSEFLTWISFDKGRSWSRYGSDGEYYMLVNNNFGKLIIIDNNNNVLCDR